jgi:hypothetical protein
MVLLDPVAVETAKYIIFTMILIFCLPVSALLLYLTGFVFQGQCFCDSAENVAFLVMAHPGSRFGFAVMFVHHELNSFI